MIIRDENYFTDKYDMNSNVNRVKIIVTIPIENV